LEPDISYIASLIGDSTRASMLTALMGGKALTATELAIEADITSQTASSHLNKLVAGQLLIVRKQGRHKYFQLGGEEIAELLERMLNLSSKTIHPKVVKGYTDLRLRKARICYDHLAGEFAVTLFDSLLKNEYLSEKGNQILLTDQGNIFFEELGVDFCKFNTKRPICRSCLDWSERRSHLAGALGQWVLNDLLSKGWITKDLDSRAITFSKNGLKQLTRMYRFSGSITL